MFWFALPAEAQEPMWIACREHRDPLTVSALHPGPVPPLPRTDARPDFVQDVPVPHLLVDAAGTWTLDGQVVDALPPLPQVLLFVDRTLSADLSLRLLEALHANQTRPLVVRLTESRAPEGVQDPDVWPNFLGQPADRERWSRALGACKEGRALLEVGGDCETLPARWKAAAGAWRCDLSESDVEALSGPLANVVPDPAAVLSLRLEPGDPTDWYRGIDDWESVRAGVRWIRVLDEPPEGALKVFHSGELGLVHRVDPKYPPAARRAGAEDARCLAKVTIGRDGVPLEVAVDGCPEVFVATTRESVMKWRWEPPLGGRVRGQTTIAVSYQLH
jgi:hypothetical protein